MKHFKFVLEDLRAISTNEAVEHSKHGVAKADKYRIFEAEFEIKMIDHIGKIEEIRRMFIEDKHCIVTEFKFYFSCETKTGRLHKRAGDCTNGVKPLEDALFQLLEIDDAFVTENHNYKIHSDKNKIVIDLWVKDYVRV